VNRPIEEIVKDISQKRKELETTRKTASDKQEFFNGLADLLSNVADYLVEELKRDNKVEVINFPDKKVQEVKVNNFRGIFGLLESISKSIKKFRLPDVFKINGEVTVKNQVTIPEVKFPEPVKTVGINSLPGYIRENLEKIARKELKVDVKAPDVKVNVPETKVEIDLTTLEELIRANNELLKALDKPQQEIDLTPVEEASNKTTEAIQQLRFPVPNFQSSFQHSLTMQSEDLGKHYVYTTVGGSKAISYIEFVGLDGKKYRKTYTYSSNDPEYPDDETAWTEV
jgi:hypothetical protein